jgi:hypothetical protein
MWRTLATAKSGVNTLFLQAQPSAGSGIAMFGFRQNNLSTCALHVMGHQHLKTQRLQSQHDPNTPSHFLSSIHMVNGNLPW